MWLWVRVGFEGREMPPERLAILKGPFCRVIRASTAHAGSGVFPRQRVANAGKSGKGGLARASLEVQEPRCFTKPLMCTSENSSLPFSWLTALGKILLLPVFASVSPKPGVPAGQGREATSSTGGDRHPAHGKRLLVAAEG